MTASMFLRIQVNDFASWKKGFDEDEAASFRRAGGVIADSVHRDADDPNTIIVYHQFTDASAQKAFVAGMDSEDFRAIAEKKGGIKLETMELWVGEDV